MKISRKGISLIEYVILGVVILGGSIALLTPYANNVAALIRGDSPKQEEATYAPPAPPTILPNTGAQGQDSNATGSCSSLTYSYLENTIDNAQYNYIVNNISAADLNATENWTAPDGTTYTEPKYIVALSDGEYYLFNFCGNPSDNGFWPGTSNLGYKTYFAVGMGFDVADTTASAPNGFSITHPYLMSSSTLASSEDGESYLVVNPDGEQHDTPISMYNMAGTHCPTYNYYSTPLIIDYNEDGKISAASGMGVDIDGNGTPDGAAVNGDKMLAMSPMYKDKVITGKEVFGDHTIDPFTGFPVKAKDGFIALKKVAISAQKHTGIKCLEGTYVDVRKLKAAMKKAKKGNLGLISDDNITYLEPLGKVAKINTDYKQVAINKQDTNDIKHRQIGNWLDVKNVSHIMHDVWFALKSAAKNIMTNVSKIFNPKG